MTEFKFSGKLAKIDTPWLKSLFGPCIPVEAADALFTASGDKTLGEVRLEISEMAKAWDPVAVNFTRLDRAIGRMSNALHHQREHLGVMREHTGDRLYGLQSVIDAAETMEACADDLDATFRDERDC